MTSGARYLRGVRLHESAPVGQLDYPLHFPWLAGLDLSFASAVTFLVGENGSGKSTLIEALAELSGLPPAGGSRAESGSAFAPDAKAALSPHLRPAFRTRPRDGYFFRAEHQAHFAALLEERATDPDFIGGDPFQHYGGKRLTEQSHGEGFMALMQNRLQQGLFFMDEPESALSPERQLALLALIADRVKGGQSQFVIATHSPILMTYPGAVILSFDGDSLDEVPLDETAHYAITRGILEHPERYWQHLMPGDEEPG